MTEKVDLSKATPLPWAIRRHPAKKDFFIEGRVPSRPYANEIMGDDDYPEKEADAALIVSCVNAREKVLALCKAIVEADKMDASLDFPAIRQELEQLAREIKRELEEPKP